MSIKLAATEIDLNDLSPLLFRPEEDAVVYIDFDKDMTGATHTIYLEEFEFPYAHRTYDVLAPVTRSTFDASEEVDGIIKHTFSAPDLKFWENRTLYIKWVVSLDGRTWVACQRKMWIGEHS